MSNTKTKMKFRLLQGTHRENGETFRIGEYVFSEKNLVKVFGGTRFAAVTESAAVRGADLTPAPEVPKEQLDKYFYKNTGRWFNVYRRENGQEIKVNDKGMGKIDAMDLVTELTEKDMEADAG